MRRLVTWCVFPLALSCGMAAWADPESGFKPRKMGDWWVFADAENPIKYDNSEAVHSAITDALNGRGGTLGIGTCGRFSVRFTFEPDATFEKTSDETDDDRFTRRVFTKVLPFGKGVSLRDTLMEIGVETWNFLFDADTMARGDTFVMCPTDKEDQRCLNFSLKGITAALKTICPKR